MTDTKTEFPTRNKLYSEDIRFTFAYLKWLAKTIGIWTLVSLDYETRDLWLAKISYLVCFCILPVVILPALLNCMFIENDLRMIIRTNAPMIFLTGCILKYLSILFHKDNIAICLNSIENDWKNVDSQSPFRAIMIKNAKIARRIVGFATLFMSIAGCSYFTIMPLTAKKQAIAGLNGTYKPLPYPIVNLKFFNAYDSPNYEIVCAVQWFYAMVGILMTSTTLGIATLFVTHISSQAQILIEKLDRYVTSDNEGDQISSIIEHHVQTMRFAQYCGEILLEISLIELLASALTLCCVGYCCLMEWEKNNAVGVTVYIGVFLFLVINLFVFCYVGELLIEESTNIGAATFEKNWYKLPNYKILELKMIIIRSMKSPKLTAGNIADVSVSTFASVLRTALAYLNLLRSVTA